MSSIIVVSHEHRLPTPVEYNLGSHTLIITRDYSTPDAFERVAPRIEESNEAGEASPGEQHENDLLIFDHDEAYYLYQCLHMLFQPVPQEKQGEA